jgi:hypothetical protein
LKVIVVSRDLLFASRIAAIAAEAGIREERVDEPAGVVPTHGDVVVLEWDDRTPQWAPVVASWAAQGADHQDGPQVIAAVSHRDLDGIRAAKAAGVAHVVARSGLGALLHSLLGVPRLPSVMG